MPRNRIGVSPSLVYALNFKMNQFHLLNLHNPYVCVCVTNQYVCVHTKQERVPFMELDGDRHQ